MVHASLTNMNSSPPVAPFPSSAGRSIVIATRGSALALAQADLILAESRAAFPQLAFEIKIIKTTGDKLQTVSPESLSQPLPKGLFTKELEVALLNGEADLAVHSLKDLPTELPAGLTLGAVSKREDVRDVLIYRAGAIMLRPPQGESEKPRSNVRGSIYDFSQGATIATGSTRRQAQLLALRSDLKVVSIRGNVGTRLRKLKDQAELDGVVLAAAGLNRLHCQISVEGRLHGDPVPEGLLAAYFTPEEMLPCVGQGAIGLEIREGDERIAAICQRLNDVPTHLAVAAERAFLHAMGGGCLSPIAAYGDIIHGQIRLQAVSFRDGKVRRGEARGHVNEAQALGGRLAAELQ
jgi:hydroxymethylbilane synthase